MSYECAYHPQQYLTHFCPALGCSVPLCSECIKIHGDENDKHPDGIEFEDLATMFKWAKEHLKGMKDKVKMIENFIKNVNQIGIETIVMAEQWIQEQFRNIEKEILQFLTEKQKLAQKQIRGWIENILDHNNQSDPTCLRNLSDQIQEFEIAFNQDTNQSLSALIIFNREESNLIKTIETKSHQNHCLEELASIDDEYIDFSDMAELLEQKSIQLSIFDQIQAIFSKFAEQNKLRNPYIIDLHPSQMKDLPLGRQMQPYTDHQIGKNVHKSNHNRILNYNLYLQDSYLQQTKRSHQFEERKQQIISPTQCHNDKWEMRDNQQYNKATIILSRNDYCIWNESSISLNDFRTKGVKAVQKHSTESPFSKPLNRKPKNNFEQEYPEKIEEHSFGTDAISQNQQPNIIFSYHSLDEAQISPTALALSTESLDPQKEDRLLPIEPGRC